jgi:hypothetical protein
MHNNFQKSLNKICSSIRILSIPPFVLDCKFYLIPCLVTVSNIYLMKRPSYFLLLWISREIPHKCPVSWRVCGNFYPARFFEIPPLFKFWSLVTGTARTLFYLDVSTIEKTSALQYHWFNTVVFCLVHVVTSNDLELLPHFAR